MDYKEMAAIVKARGDKILEERRIRAIRIRRVTTTVSSICAVAVICLGVWHNSTIKRAMPDPSGSDNIIATSATTSANHNNITTTCVEDTRTSLTTAVSYADKTAITTTVSSTASKYDITRTDVQTTVTTAKTVSTAMPNTSGVTSASSAKTTAISTSTKMCTTASTATSVVTTTSPKESDIVVHERSYFMNKISKRFLAFFTAATVMPSPMNTDAVNDLEFLSNPINIADYFKRGSWEAIKGFKELCLDPSKSDLNDDGVFDVKDVHLFWRATNGDHSISLSKDIDVNHDGRSNTNEDGNFMLKYFLYYNQIKPEYFDFDYYSSDDVDRIESPYLFGSEMKVYEAKKRYEFLRALASEADYLHCFYDIFNERVKSGKVDIDVDGNGVFDLGDVTHLYAYEYKIKDMLINTEYFNSFSYAEKRQYLAENSAGVMDDAVFERCMALNDNFIFAGNELSSLGSYALLHYFYNHDFKPEYTDERFYSYLTDHVYDDDAYALSTMMYDVYRYCEGMGIAGCDMRQNVSTDDFENEYARYVKKVANGLISEPDINMDGKINMADYVYIDDIYNNCRYGENEEYSKMIIDHFLNDFDLNENGISGDCVDCMICQAYVSEKLNINNQLALDYEQFKYLWINNSVYTDQYTDGTNCLTNTLYPTSDPDLLFSLCPNYVYAFRYRDAEEREAILKQYVIDIENYRLPGPDVNMDGVINEMDYFCAEITRYAQTHTDQNIDFVPKEVMQNYVTNFDLDHNGLSGDYMDTLMVLEYVAHMGGCKEVIEDQIPVILGYRSGYSVLEDDLVTTVPDWSLLGKTVTTTTTVADADMIETGGMRGDANCDDNVDLSDSVLIMQALANPNKYDIGGTAPKPITPLGKKNADVDKAVKGVTAGDALRIQQYLLHNISKL